MDTSTPSWPEAARLSTLRQYEILDTAVDPAFDAFTRLATRICETPMAAISLVDRDRLWFKSEIGLQMRQAPRDSSFCDLAIRTEGLFVVPDAAVDPRFQRYALVADGPHVKYYAGARLDSGDGVPIGTLCVLDRKPRHLSASQEEALVDLASQVMALLELKVARRHLLNVTEQAADLSHQLMALQPTPQSREPAKADPVAPSLAKKILLVEDDDGVRELASEQLASLGYRVITASNGPAALEMLAGAADVDLLFTDIIMPGGLNGREVAEQACLMRPDLKVLYASGYFEGALLRNGIIKGAVPLLVKPYLKKDLAQKVREVLA